MKKKILNKEFLKNAQKGFTLMETLMAASILSIVIGGALYIQNMTFKTIAEEQVKVDFSIFMLALKNNLTENCVVALGGIQYNTNLSGEINTPAKGMIPGAFGINDIIADKIRIEEIRVQLLDDQFSAESFDTPGNLAKNAELQIKAKIYSESGKLAAKALYDTIPLIVFDSAGTNPGTHLHKCAVLGTYASKCLSQSYPVDIDCGDITKSEEHQINLGLWTPMYICATLGMIPPTYSRNYCDLNNPNNHDNFLRAQNTYYEIYLDQIPL